MFSTQSTSANPPVNPGKPSPLIGQQPAQKLNPFAPNGSQSKLDSQPTADSQPSKAGSSGNSQANPFTNRSPSSAASHAQDWGHHKHGYVQPAWPASKDTKSSPPSRPAPSLNAANGKRKDDGGHQDRSKFPKSAQRPKSGSDGALPTGPKLKRGEKPRHGTQTPKPQQPRVNGQVGDVATKIHDQLAKDGIKPPQWPANPGSTSQRKAVEKFREAYSVYREKAMKSLIQAGLFDDPDKKRRLSEAINFKGICEGMCPDWDKVTRIVQHDVKKEEKEEIDGELVASLPLMVTRYSRSSAGQDLPLPMDVRSPAALRRTLDYLISELIPSDDLLPIRHHFLWDRTRSIRREFTFQGAAMSAEEKQDYLYCLETITRFHVTALHLLSRPDFAPDDFSEQQEVEQLSKTLISLMEAYDDCAKEDIACANEAEFRGYYIVFNAGDPALMEKVQSWDPKFSESSGIKTAICLAQSLQNTWTETGPLVPKVGTEMALNMAAMFFSIVASPAISYTMACFAELHFGSARHAMLQTILNGYQRPKDGPKDLTPTFLKERLHFDTEEEAICFAKLHNFKFSKDAANMHMILPPSSQQRRIPKPRIPHTYSYGLVERKRGGHSLPEVIYQTIWDDGHDGLDEDMRPASPQNDSLFVDSSEGAVFDADESDAETSNTAQPLPTPPVAEKHASRSLASSPFSLLSPRDGRNGAPVAALTASQGPQARESVFNQATRSSRTSNSLFPTPPQSLFNQGNTPKQSENPTVLSTTPSTQTTNAPSGISSTTADRFPNLFNSAKDVAPASSTMQQSTVSNEAPAASPANKETPPRLIFSSTASAPSAGFQFPSVPGASSSPAEPAAKITPPISFGNASFTTAFTGEASALNGQWPTTSLQKPAQLLSSTPSSSVFQPSGGSPQPSKEPPNFSSEPPPPPPVGLKTPVAPSQECDPVEGLTRWYVSGDRGLMETQLEPSVLEILLRRVWDEYHRAEEERKRKEEEENSRAEARKYRECSLSVKYFYIWRDGFRRRRTVKRIQAEREKARQWRLPENVAKREAAARTAREKAVEEAKDLMHKRTRGNIEETRRLNSSTTTRRESLNLSTQPRRQSRKQSIEDALLASGVLDGVRNPHEAARDAAKEDKLDSDERMLPGQQMLLRAKNQRRKKQGLQPLKQLPEPKVYKEGTKSAMLKALSNGSTKDSLSMSTGSFRNSTFSSSYRSSLGFNNSRVSKAKSKVTDPYWRLKASGLVQMPNGEYLPESLALPMLQEGKRFPGLGDYGLPREPSASPSHSPPREGSSLLSYATPSGARRSRVNSSSSVNNLAQKRKRIYVDGEEESDNPAATHRGETSGDRKRTKSGGEHDVISISDDTDLLSSIDNLLRQVEEVNRASSQG
ncbi:hypothetical protein DL764_003968 [Monosporascus ibericus]|uniref:SAC3/GANP/THP3 conserved domain-containing protein n=1 Tax=Monosporascus ibericus TaxID=155417 RepID=A0A4Q4TF44_9PEZI|nr:hypothetical protein DL764_003968 [Monosporascus ibericus]